MWARLTRALRELRGGSLPDVPPPDRERLRRELDSLEDADRRIVERALPMTMTGIPRLLALLDAVRYCTHRALPGAFVECGVWRGGSVVAMLLTLSELGVDDRDVYLYDTFEGMTPPTEHDVSRFDGSALEAWRTAQAQDGRLFPELFDPEFFSEEKVRETVLATGYPEGRLHFIKGPVEETLPSQSPASVSLLRLDTDWYESTLHELRHLYPLLSPGGVLIVDDYGHWDGCRRAFDEYFGEHLAPLLNRIDYAGRIGIKA